MGITSHQLHGLPFAVLIVTCTLVFTCTRVHGFAPVMGQISTRKVLQSPLKISLEDEWSDLATSLTKTTRSVDVEFGQIAKEVSEIEWTKLLAPGPGIAQVEDAVNSIWTAYLTLPIWAEAGVVLLPMLSLLVATLYALSFPADDFRLGYEPYLRGQYDPLQARVYYSNHPKLVLQRSLQLLRISSRYLANVWVDKYIFKDEESVRSKRAQEFLDLVNKAGPTAIKVGQVRLYLHS